VPVFGRLLVAIDGTERGEVVLSFALAVAARHASEVTLLHVNEFVVGSPGVPLRTDAEATQLVLEALTELRAAGIPATGTVRRATYREIAERIASVADECGADAIILGSGTARRRRAALFSGRVTERTMRLTSLPVIAAPAPLAVSARDYAALADELVQPPARERTPSERWGG
jgi:nucleotide-binding universal stress UspA family protein